MCIGQSNIHGLGDTNLLTTLAAIYVSCHRGILSGVVIQFSVHCICFRLVILMSLYVNPPLSDLAVCTCLTIITATEFTNCPACIYRTSGTGLCLSEDERHEGERHTQLAEQQNAHVIPKRVAPFCLLEQTITSYHSSPTVHCHFWHKTFR